MLKIKQTGMKAILTFDSVEVGNWDDKNKRFIPGITLKKSDIRVKLIDVVYYAQEETGGFTIKRGDERVENVPSGVISNTILTKRYGWAYENEVRFIISVSKMKIPNNIEFNTARINIKDAIDKCPGSFIPVRAPNAKVEVYQPSQLDKIEWDLCSNCESRR